MTDVAPDFLGPLAAWRAWNVAETEAGRRLTSIHYRETWPVGDPIEAWCYRSSAVGAAHHITHARHLAPVTGCHCGIYAATSLDRVREYLVADHAGWEHVSPRAERVHRVVGLVSLWGRLIECEQGYRGSLAYPAHLWVPTHTADSEPVDVEALALDRVDDAVPVELLDARSRVEIVDRLDGLAQASSTT